MCVAIETGAVQTGCEVLSAKSRRKGLDGFDIKQDGLLLMEIDE